MGKVSNFWTFFSAWYSRKMKLIFFFGIFESFSKVRNFHARLSVHFSEFRSARVNFFGLNCESALKNFTFCFTFPDWKNCFPLGWEFQPPRVRSASLILFRKRKINHFQIRPEVINFACVWKIGRSTKTSPDFSFLLESGWQVEQFSPRKELFGVGFMLRWFGQVFPPWSDHPPPSEGKTVRGSILWKRGKFRTSCNVSFCTWFWIWPAFEESFVTWTPRRRRRRRPGRTGGENLKYANSV